MQIVGLYSTALFVLIGAIALGYLFVQLPAIRRSFLPASVAAGLLLLVLGPEVAGVFPGTEWAAITHDLYHVWEPLPGTLISLVFAMLFLGRPLRSIKGMWRLAAPQATFGQLIAWGYYAVGGGVTLLVLQPLFGEHALAAALLEISFDGGHGTAAGMAPVFQEFNYHAGQEMAVALATTSLFATLAVGFILIQFGRRLGLIDSTRPPHEHVRGTTYHRRVLRQLAQAGVSLRQELNLLTIARHVLLIALSVGAGLSLHGLLLIAEQHTWAHQGIKIFGYMPSFMFCMFGGMLMQAVWRHVLHQRISRPLVELMSGMILAVLVATAIATMKLDFIATNGLTFIILVVSGVVWVLLCFVIAARMIFPAAWFTHGLITIGQAMGTTATGLLFAQIVDPKQQTGAVESFSYKQLMFEPFMGGGIVTALAMPCIMAYGLPLFTAISSVIAGCWLIFGVIAFGRRA